MTKRYQKVAVLLGGRSPEREVSLVSGKAAAKALRAEGYDVTEVDANGDVAADLAAARPDAVFNALHGIFGEDGCVQGLLEMMDIPYTHSGVMASALAMDKQRAKAILEEAGVPCPKGKIVPRGEAARGEAMARPFVVKPNNQGSSVGVFIIRDGDDRGLKEIADPKWDLGDEVLVEEFIAGRELTATVMGNRALCVTEIVTDATFYDYEAKYAAGGSHHVVPADIPAEVTARVLDLALRAHVALGCRGLSRSDFRYDADRAGEQLFCLETNTQPGLTPTSLSPEQAAHLGISFNALCAWMVEDASCRR